MSEPDFTAYAGRVRIRFKEAQAGKELKHRVERAISGIALACVRQGATLIGHIKCIADVDSGGFIRCSSVSHDGRVNSSGELADGAEKLDLVLNVLIYGLGKEEVEQVVVDRVKTELGGDKCELEFEDLEHADSGHGHEGDHDH